MREKLRGQILFNLGWKIFALVLAAVIWFLVNPQSATQKVLSKTGGWKAEITGVRIRVLAEPGQRTDWKITPDEVSVTLYGDQSMIDYLKGADVQAFVNMADLRLSNDERDGTNGFARPVLVRAPPGISLTIPSSESVLVERVAPVPVPANKP